MIVFNSAAPFQREVAAVPELMECFCGFPTTSS
jgi:hypothetical protein